MRNLDRRESTGEEDKQAEWTRIMMIQNEIKDRQAFNWRGKKNEESFKSSRQVKQCISFEQSSHHFLGAAKMCFTEKA